MAVNVNGISCIETFGDDRKDIRMLRFDIKSWCNENIGPIRFISMDEIKFDCPEDEMAFILRWK